MIKNKKLFFKKITRLLVVLILLFGLSLTIEITAFNFNILKLNRSERISERVELFKDENNNINIKNKGYVNKIKISYLSPNDFNIILNYQCQNVYKAYEVKQLIAPSSYKLGVTIENINCNIKDLNISTDNTQTEILDIVIDNTFKVNYYRLLFIFIIILIFYLLIAYRNSYLKNIENKFLIVALGIGLLIIILMPNSTFYSYDDETHFKNSIGITDFLQNKITDSVNQMEYALPFPFKTITSFEEIAIQNNYLNFNHSENFILHNRNKYSFNIGSYIPVGISLYLLNALDVPFVVMFKLGKLVNLLFYIVVSYYAIKKIKIFKRLFFVLALLPTSIYMACNYSYDSVLTSCILLSMATIINNYVAEKNSITLKNNILPLLLMLYGIITKAVYAPLILIALFIPKNKFKTKKENRNYKIAIIVVVLLLMSSFILPTILSPAVEGDYRVENTSVSTQMDTVIEHPFGYAKVLKDNALNNFFDKLIGNQTLIEFGYLGTTNGNLYYLILIIIIFASITDKYNQKKSDFPKKFILINIISILGTIILIWTALYLSFNEVGSTFIGGVQWRYFIPILPSLLIMMNKLCNIKNEIDSKKYDVFISIMLYIILVLCIYNFIIVPIHL